MPNAVLSACSVSEEAENEQENLSVVTALKSSNPAVAAEQLGKLCMHCLRRRPHLRGRGKPKNSSTELLRKLTNVCRWCTAAAAAAAGCAACFAHGASACFWAISSVAGAHRHWRPVVMLSLLIQFLPFDPVGFNHVNHGLKFGIQLDQCLGREYFHHRVIIFREMWAVHWAKHWNARIFTLQTS